jgi:pilus assembly protein Flp/PilA
MIAYMRNVRRHARSDDGASAVEYGLLVAAIAAVIVVIVFALGSVVQKKFQDTCSGVATGQTATAPADCNTK